MDTKTLREQNQTQLQERLANKVSELDSKCYDLRTAKETDHSSLKKLKTEIARIKTILKERSYSTNEKVAK